MTDDKVPVHVVQWPGGSLYAMLFGDGSEGHSTLADLGFRNLGELGRYRDLWLERGPDGQARVAVYTRVGGGNREGYAKEITGMQANPLYLFDRDDIFDDTYATFYFQVPPPTANMFRDHLGENWQEQLQPPVDMNEVWKEALDQIERSNEGDQDDGIDG